MCRLKANESFVKLQGLFVMNSSYFAIICHHLSLPVTSICQMDHSFLLFPTKSQFPLLNVDIYRPEIPRKGRNRPQLEVSGLTSHEPCCINVNRTRSSYIPKAGKVEGGFGSCLPCLPYNLSDKESFMWAVGGVHLSCYSSEVHVTKKPCLGGTEPMDYILHEEELAPGCGWGGWGCDGASARRERSPSLTGSWNPSFELGEFQLISLLQSSYCAFSSFWP